MKRIPSHIIEENGVNYFRKFISENSDGNALYREISGRDYGIDGLVEIFEEGYPTGKIAFIQIKSTSKKIAPLKSNPNFISSKITNSNAYYCFQKNIPVFLVYVQTGENELFYFEELNKLQKDLENKLNINNITIRIPIENLVKEDLSIFLNEIKNYYMQK